MSEWSVLSVAAVFAALAIGGFSKGATGLGLPFVAMPVLAQLVGVERAVAIMALPGLFSNGWLVWVHRRHMNELRPMRAFIVVGFFGGVIGTWFLSAANPGVLLLSLAAGLGAYLVFHLLHPHFRLSEAANRVVGPPLGMAAGAVQGATGVSAPLIAPYVHALDLTKHGYVLGVAVAFAVFSVSQIVALVYFGVLTPMRAVEGAAAMIPVMAFLTLGVRFSSRIDKQTFERLLIFVFVLLEIKLIYDGVRALSAS